MSIKKINLIALVAMSLSLAACQATFEETTNYHQQDGTSMKINEVSLINSGSRISWEIDVSSQYSDTVIGIGKWNYEEPERHNFTELDCNNYNVDCREIKKVECDLISMSGNYETLECRFKKEDGSFFYGSRRYIDVPYTTGNEDTLLNPTVRVSGYDGYYTYIFSYVFNVNYGDFVGY